MEQETKNGRIFGFESIREREKRLQVVAEGLYSICEGNNLNISDYEAVKNLLDIMVYGRAFIGGQQDV